MKKYAENKDSGKKKKKWGVSTVEKQRINEDKKEKIKVWEWYSLCACA